MNPFEKRDKIPRTPPGLSIDGRSFSNFDQSANADCSLYDDSGLRVFDLSVNLKRYTLTFEEGKNSQLFPNDFRVSLTDANRPLTSLFCTRPSILQANNQLCTSSPLGKTVSPIHVRPSSTNPAEGVIEALGKENIAPSVQEVSIAPNGQSNQHKLDASALDQQSSIEQSEPTPSLEQSTVPTTVRRLRPRRPASVVDSTAESIRESKRGKRKRTDYAENCSSNSSSSGTTSSSPVFSASGKRHRISKSGKGHGKAKRQLTEGAGNSPSTAQADSPSQKQIEHTYLQTPATLVAKPRGRTRNAAWSSSTISPNEVVTVLRRGAVRTHGVCNQSVISSTDTSLESVSLTVRRKRTAVKTGKVSSKAVELDVLNVSAITPVPARKPRRKKANMNDSSLSQDEPIATRLRVRSSQISYVETNLTRTGATRCASVSNLYPDSLSVVTRIITA